jgi:predicted porin
MKKYAALAVLAAGTATASAQSSVTIFGVLDAGASVVKNGAAGSVKSLETSGNETSRLGFRGIEDLGGGLRAGFEFQGQLFNDTGNLSGMNWQRRSTVSLMSDSLGELRLGRDYNPTYWNRVDFDPFGNNGVGNMLNMMSLSNPIQTQNQTAAFPGAVNTTPLGSGATTLVRTSNSVGYFLPGDLGGVYGQAMVGAGEGVVGNKYAGGRLGYKLGALNVAASYGKTTLGVDDLKSVNAGASYDFGMVKLMGMVDRETFDRSAVGQAVQKNLLIGATAPLGPGAVRVSYNRAQISGVGTGVTGLGNGSAHMLAAGYVYDLSKRTALYTSASRISNDAGVQFTVGPNGPSMNGLTGQTSTGYEFGIRHRF